MAINLIVLTQRLGFAHNEVSVAASQMISIDIHLGSGDLFFTLTLLNMLASLLIQSCSSWSQLAFLVLLERLDGLFNV